MKIEGGAFSPQQSTFGVALPHLRKKKIMEIVYHACSQFQT